MHKKLSGAIRIDNKLLFFFFFIKPTIGIVYVYDLLFDFDSKKSCGFYKQKGFNNGFFDMDRPIRPGPHRNRQWQLALWRKPQEQQTSFRTELNDYCVLMVSYQLMNHIMYKIGTTAIFFMFFALCFGTV